MIRPLTAGDTLEARSLLRERPLHNVFLDYVVAAGVLGRAPGIFGWTARERLEAILMIGPFGGTALEVRDHRAYAALAEAAARVHPQPRHIVGSEDVSSPFWREYERHAAGLRWTRREPVFVVGRRELCDPRAARERGVLEPARESDLAEVSANSAEQHREDLGDDRAAADARAFREQHARDIRDGRWWVVRERGRIGFQVHVGASSPHAVQIGGVFVPADARGQGRAVDGVRRICARLLERHERVTLYCDEANSVARRVYQRTGFQLAFWNRSYLLESPVAREERAAEPAQRLHTS